MKRITLVSMIFILVLSITSSATAQVPIDFLYQFPGDGAQYVPTATTLTFNSPQPIVPAGDLATFFAVSGDQGGAYGGRVVLSVDHKSLIFQPERAFQAGERVAVRLKPGIRTAAGSVLNGKAFSFTVSRQAAAAQTAAFADLTPSLAPQSRAAADPAAATFLPYRTLPAGLPPYEVTVPANGTGDGFIFFANLSQDIANSYKDYLFIVDNNGEPVYYHLLSGLATDFKKQPNGLLTYFSSTEGYFLVMDSSYQVVDHIQAGNGYPTDVHELQVLPNGHALLMIYDTQTVDMTDYGGLVDAQVIGLVVQELDEQKNVVFQWRSWDYLNQIPYTASNQDWTAARFDHVHGNAIEMDFDGNLMVSTRHLSSILKISRANGDILWMLGGQGNQFSFIDDEGFNHQHDIRRLENGDITLFDNHLIGGSPDYSRAVQYELDEVAKTVTRVWQFRNTPDAYARVMGDAQRLPNGNTVIGWGSSTSPAITEVKMDGSKAFEISLPSDQFNYRAFRFPWQGYPVTTPDLVVEKDGSMASLYTSWNGATEIQSYKVYGGVLPGDMHLLTEVSKTGFETSVDITSWLADACYFQVMPVDKDDQDTTLSNQVFLAGPACHPMYFPFIPAP